MAGSYSFKEIEQQAQAHWRKIQLLERIEEKNKDGERYFLLDGPPYANNIPHVGHVRNTVYKDLYLRYAMMQGKSVLFQPGFDTHGLPIENMVEKQLNLTSKQDIEKLGIQNFTQKCKESAALNKDLWLAVYDQLGSWYSWKEPYLTYDNSYVESAWWAFSQVWEKGYVYEGRRPVHWCPHCQTALAGYEATDSYKVVSDPGVYVKFKLRDEEDTYFLVFTTTPWTLPANVGLCVNGNEEYVKAKTEKHGTLILAKNLITFLDKISLSYDIIETFKGSALDGLKYEPLMDVRIQHDLRGAENALRVFMSIPMLKERVASKVGAKKGIQSKDLFEDFVTVTDGTGIVHTAPGHGHTDNAIGKHYNMPELSPVDEEARFTDEVPEYQGQQVREASHKIADDLARQGKLVHFERIEHSYPLCWRCKTPLIFRLSRQWFIRIDNVKDALLEANENITWQPEFAQERMHNWVINAGDWNFSRQRYWGIPIPIWICECGKQRVIASKSELAQEAAKAGAKVPDDADLHTAGLYPIPCECGEHMKRVPDIFDVWYDSGCAPFASLGYPYKNKRLFETHYPISRINESQDQIRGWFYHLLFVGQLAFDKPPLKQISMPGWVVDEKGEKMSKSLGNVVWAKDAMEEFGADSLRFYYCWDVAPYVLQKFNKSTVKAEVGKFFTILWNLTTLCQSQLQQHAERGTEESGAGAMEDAWLISRKNTVLRKYFESIESFELHEGCRELYDFVINDISRTYVQFTRERAEEDSGVAILLKSTLRDIYISLAPITPFISEIGFRQLAGKDDPASVHLCDLPQPGESDPALESEFVLAQTALAGILAARDKAQIGVRWPIGEARIIGDERISRILDKYSDLIMLKANIRKVDADGLEIKMDITPDMGAIGRLLGQETADFLEEFPQHRKAIITKLEAEDMFDWRGKNLGSEHFKIMRTPPDTWICMPCGDGLACVHTVRTPELEREGYAREIIRRIQQLRKTAGLVKSDRIRVEIAAADSVLREALHEHSSGIAERTGATQFELVGTLNQHLEHVSTEKVKGISFAVGFSRA